MTARARSKAGGAARQAPHSDPAPTASPLGASASLPGSNATGSPQQRPCGSVTKAMAAQQVTQSVPWRSPSSPQPRPQNGRAAGRESVGEYEQILEVGGSLKKKQ